ncbi:MAG: hypothetical protein AB7F43_07935 [Bacteriovoracia bacterium]
MRSIGVRFFLVLVLIFNCSLSFASRPLKDILSFEDFTSLLKHNANRVPGLTTLWRQDQNGVDISRVYWGGGTFRGYLRWHFLQLQNHSIDDVKGMPIPSAQQLQLSGGKDFDIFGPRDLYKKIKRRLRAFSNLDYIDLQTHGQFAKLGGTTLEKSGINPFGILDPLDGIRHYYEGRIVFSPSDAKIWKSRWVLQNDYSKTAEALRYIRFAHFNLPELKPDQGSLTAIRSIAGKDEALFLQNEGRVAWIEISLEKLFTAAKGNLFELLSLFKKYNLLTILAPIGTRIPIDTESEIRNWVVENKDKLDPLEQNLLKDFMTPKTAYTPVKQDLKSGERQISFLGYMRRAFPEIYQEIMVRLNPLEFLNTAQEAIEKVGFSIDKPFQAKKFTLLKSTQHNRIEGDSRKLKENLLWFCENYPNKKRTLKESLLFDLRQSSLLDGLHTALILSGAVPEIAEILKLSGEEKIQRLETLLDSIDHINGINPNRLGIDKSDLSGKEFLALYRAAIESEERLPYLVWMSALNLNLNHPIAALQTSIHQLDEDQLLDRLNPKKQKESIHLALSQLEGNLQGPLTRKKVHRAFNGALNHLNEIVPLKAPKPPEKILELTQAHPFAAWFRGLLGDCSTEISFGVPLASKEEVYWIRTFQQANQKESIRGYLQYTNVQVNGENAIYVITISGTEVSQKDVRHSLLTLFESLHNINASKLLIPIPEHYQQLINFPEVEAVFHKLAQTGKVVPVTYLDGEDRVALAPFTDGSLDLPEFNSTAIEVSREDLENLFTDTHQDLQVVKEHFEIRSEHLFPGLSTEEALIIALETRERLNESLTLTKVLENYHIPKDTFESLWTLLKNESHLSVEEFHLKIQESLQALSRSLEINISFDRLKQTALLYRGHFNASNAVTGSHKELAAQYISKFLLSLSNLEYVYSSLTPHFSTLVKQPSFVALVRYLFRKLKKENIRLLDYYELESKSVYRTLANLFKAGLPVSYFKDELNELDNTTPNNALYLRQATLLGLVTKSTSYFEQIMARLEQISVESEPNLHGDDLGIVSSYLAWFMQLDTTTDDQINRIYHFLADSEFGMRFTHSLGGYKLERLNVPGLASLLFQRGKPLWAAMLIHKDPWPEHPDARIWLNQLWVHRDQIGDQTLFDGIRVNPKWLDVEGIDLILDGLMESARASIGFETILVKALLRKPETLSTKRIKWLENVTTKDLAELITGSIEPSALTRRLIERFPDLPCSPLLKEKK